MVDAALFLWDFSVAVGAFGIGYTALRLLRVRKAPLALAGVFGISLLITLGGWLNLLHLLRRSVFFALIGIGVVLAAVELLRAFRRSSVPERQHAQSTQRAPLSLPAKLLYAAAIALIGMMMLGGMRPILWNSDDLQGYATLAVKASQMHSIQPDPFCERRVQAGVGGANFLDTMMLAEGDLRAMIFIDSTFGLFLYALGLWTIGRRWNVPPAGIALALLSLPFATLMKLNLTIIYLSAAAFFAVLILLSDIKPDTRFGIGRILVLGVIVGALVTTKSPNIVFIVPFLLAAALLRNFFEPRAKAFLPIFLSLLVALAVFLPYSVANKTNAGTYLYPLLGRGIHVSAYHLIPAPAQVGDWRQLVILLIPNLLFLGLSLIVAWKLTRDWAPWPHATVIAFLFAALVAVPITVYGLGGEGADRYTAPFIMPALLLFLLIVLGALDVRIMETSLGLWRRVGTITLTVAGLYIGLFLGWNLGWYQNIKIMACESVGTLPAHYSYSRLTPNQIQQKLAYAAHIQAALPPRATAISITNFGYSFDFRRNTIYIADLPGMASPPPGLPIDQSPEAQRQFLVDHGVHYIIYDRRFPYPFPNITWEAFLHQPGLHYRWIDVLGFAGVAHIIRTEGASHVDIGQRIGFAHTQGPWARVEFFVECHERMQLYQIVEHSPQVYNDGRIIVARIN